MLVFEQYFFSSFCRWGAMMLQYLIYFLREKFFAGFWAEAVTFLQSMPLQIRVHEVITLRFFSYERIIPNLLVFEQERWYICRSYFCRWEVHDVTTSHFFLKRVNTNLVGFWTEKWFFFLVLYLVDKRLIILQSFFSPLWEILTLLVFEQEW